MSQKRRRGGQGLRNGDRPSGQVTPRHPTGLRVDPSVCSQHECSQGPQFPATLHPCLSAYRGCVCPQDAPRGTGLRAELSSMTGPQLPCLHTGAGHGPGDPIPRRFRGSHWASALGISQAHRRGWRVLQSSAPPPTPLLGHLPLSLPAPAFSWESPTSPHPFSHWAFFSASASSSLWLRPPLAVPSSSFPPWPSPLPSPLRPQLALPLWRGKVLNWPRIRGQNHPEAGGVLECDFPATLG